MSRPGRSRWMSLKFEVRWMRRTWSNDGDDLKMDKVQQCKHIFLLSTFMKWMSHHLRVIRKDFRWLRSCWLLSREMNEFRGQGGWKCCWAVESMKSWTMNWSTHQGKRMLDHLKKEKLHNNYHLSKLCIKCTVIGVNYFEAKMTWELLRGLLFTVQQQSRDTSNPWVMELYLLHKL